MRLLSVGALTIAAVCGLAACGGASGDASSAGGRGSGGEVRAVDGPVDMGSLNEVCAGNVALTSAPPYTGPTPHPVALFSQQQGNDPTGSTFPVRLLQDMGQPERDAFLAPPAQAQLVACAERDAREPTDVICHFDIGSQEQVPFFRTSYRITVRAARTGQVVATVPVNPAAAGCPTSVKVAWSGAEVFSAPTDRQIVTALTPFVSWDGTGTPPASTGPEDAPAAGGAPVIAGSVQMTTGPGVDPASPAVRVHLTFWDAFARAQEGDRAALGTLLDQVDGSFFGMLTTLLDQNRAIPGRSVRGPLRLLVTGVSAGPEGGAVAVDSCLDETGRETLEQSLPTGQIGIASRIRVNLARDSTGEYRVTGFADAPPAPCPSPAGRIS
ncbi:hypothetical protein Franean1_0342 [Parafrankia sp. EAN1pec]|uniref:hypothetical protein n=1 Tax=Parafrankia sp. (strain EAN1pec) TaxID=298653 RepID=UPI00005426E8|nr:hypothetical protein Franean1_0342 [Frankia sp. EAN1pec]